MAGGDCSVDAVKGELAKDFLVKWAIEWVAPWRGYNSSVYGPVPSGSPAMTLVTLSPATTGNSYLVLLTTTVFRHGHTGQTGAAQKCGHIPQRPQGE